ncbi:MAG: VWA domain-containing protein, partial [Bacteroidota bacterium]
MELVIGSFRFLHGGLLLLLLIIPILVFWYMRNRKNLYPSLRMSTLQPIQGMVTWRGRLRGLLPVFRVLSLLFFIIALARPQQILKEEDIKAEGIDIFLVMDLSNSMLAQDFKPNRLEVSKDVALEFVDKRAFDRIGLSVFSGEAFTQCPLTTDHRVVKEFLRNLSVNMLTEQGTAIGMGLASAINRLKNSESKSKVAILLTDGVNNAGYIMPETATEIA